MVRGGTTFWILNQNKPQGNDALLNGKSARFQNFDKKFLNEERKDEFSNIQENNHGFLISRSIVFGSVYDRFHEALKLYSVCQ